MNKSPESNKNEPHDDLRQQLWELSYGLLEDDAAAALRTQIKSDPAIARLYSEVRLQADLVGRAARVEDLALQISAGPDSKAARSGSRYHPKSTAGKNWQAEQRAWGTNWLAVGGTVALLVLLAFGLYQPGAVTNSVAQADYFFTQITAPAQSPEGVTQTVEINTTDVHNNGRSAELAVRLVDREGRETFRKELKTSKDGKAAFELPGNVLRPGVRLEAIPKEEARHDRAAAVVSAELQVTEEKKRKLLLLEKPSAKAGETVGFSMMEIGEYSKQLSAPDTNELMIENRAGADVVQPTWEADRKSGVISGQFALPRDPAIESEQLAIRRRALPEAQDKLATSDDGRDASRKSDMLTERQELPLDRAGKRGVNRSLANGAMAAGGAFGGNAASDADASRLQRAAVAKAAELKANPLSKAAVPGEGESKPEVIGGEGGGGVQTPVPLPALARGVPQNAPPSPAPGGPPKPAALPVAPAAPAPPAASNPEGEPAPQQVTPGATPDRKNAEKNFADAQAQANGAAVPPGANGKAGAMKAQQGGYAITPNGLGQTKDGRNIGDDVVEAAANSKPRAEGVDKPTTGEAPVVAALAASLPGAKTAGRNLQELAAATELHIPTELQDQELVLVARRGGDVIARRELAAGKKLKQLELPPEVDGRVEIELFRKGAGTEPAYRQQLVRTAVRALHFDVEGLQDSYKPGEKVRLQVRVVDEKGQPAAAAVGVRVWNDVAAAATNSPLLLVDALAREEEVSVQAQQLAMAPVQQDAQFREAAKQSTVAANAAATNATLKNAAASNRPAAPGAAGLPEVAPTPAAEVALAPEQRQMKRMADAEQDKALNQQAEEKAGAPSDPKFEPSQVVADNRAVVQQEYDAALAATQAQYFGRIRAIGRVLVWAGAGLMLLIGVLLIARSQLKTAVWVPAVGIAAVCLALGLAWFVPAQPVGWQLARVESFGTAPATPEEAKQPAEPPTVAIAPSLPIDAPATPASPELAMEAFKEVAPGLPVVQPAKPGETPAGGSATDEKMKLLRADQQLADAKQGDAANPQADGAADKPQAKKSAEREVLERRNFSGSGSLDVAPDTLFWRPLSLVGSDGLLTIEFSMPAAESDYRLLLDAVGNGRIGGQQQLLICREPE